MADPAARLTSALAGRYTIERELGQGGMATVYLAEDVRHHRKVALKVLRPELAAVIGAERFLKEIETTANLQHPHILPLHDSGEVDGTAFYVMPFVEGESLRDRLTREKQLPIDSALRIASEVASALDYAHRHGVIHRDIKPENILLHDGQALVVDFGIALAAANTGGTRMTETGMSLGTPQYMSPEQAMGERTLDARTDVYALGVVLYEMLVGEPPFTGPTAQSIVAKVMTEEPRAVALQRRSVPEHVDDALFTALAKLPADRFASATEFAAALVQQGPRRRRPAIHTTSHARGLRSIATPVLAAIALGAVALATWALRRASDSSGVTRWYVAFPDAEAMRPGFYTYALSPDGNAMVYVGRGEVGTQLWLKRRSELHATPVGGTNGARNPFLSPDGNWVGFVAEGQLRKVPIAGGAVATLAEASCGIIGCTGFAESGAWLDDGRIVYQSRGMILMVDESGGAPDTLVRSVDVLGLGPMLPVALPKARGVLFNACTLGCNKSEVWVADLQTRKARRLVEDATFPRYSPTGHLLYSDRRGSVSAVPFDLATLEVRGSATSVLEHVAGHLMLSSDGTLLYLEGDASPRSEIVTVSRDGRVTPLDSTWRGNFASLALSPDGKKLAATIAAEGQEHVWIKRIDGGPPSRLTFSREQSATPAWSADGNAVLYTQFSRDTARLMRKRADGTGDATVVEHAPVGVIEAVASRDGQWLVLREYRDGARDIFALRTDGVSTQRAVVASPVDEYSPALSPDAKWLAYASEETGVPEVWVSPFPDPQGSKWQVSTQGGWEPVWSHSGKEIFFVNAAQELVAVEVVTVPSFALGPQRTLFSLTGYRRHPTHRAYDVLPNDQQFVMIRAGTAATGNLVMVENWLDELKAKLHK